MTTISLETSQRMESAGPSAGKGGGFMCHFGPSAAETLVSPRREEWPHQTNRGRNNIFSLPGQEGYIAWTRRPPFPPLGLDLFNLLLKKIELKSRLFFSCSLLPSLGYQPKQVSQRKDEFS